jgi:putative flavoprotein involved in K+ transport
MAENIHTLIIGGGQAGLSLSYYLSQHGLEHLVLEAALQAGSAWRKRWDSFTLVTPNWQTRLPGAEYQGPLPDGFMPRDEVIVYLEHYVQYFHLPVRYGLRAHRVKQQNGRYQIVSESGTFSARNVVVATGLFQKPRVPAFAAQLPSFVLQLTSEDYRKPELLPEGAVLVVGSAQSGCQIAEELYQSGRKVYLCVGSAGRVPRRYRGKDSSYWLTKAGFFDRTPDKLPSPKAKFAGNPHLSGKAGGHTLNLHQFARDGVTLLGHIADARDGKVFLKADLKENLAKADQIEANLLKMIDAYIAKAGVDAPAETLSQLRDGYDAEEIHELELSTAGISSVIWATGYSFDYSWVKLPVLDEDGFPVQQHGVTDYPGLYFLGMPWLHTMKSGLLLGVGEDAAYIASHIVSRNQGVSREQSKSVL